MPSSAQNRIKVVIVGGGPAGLMAAITAARGGARVTLLEQLDRLGVKLKATGGGRCNLTNTLAFDSLAARFGRPWRFLLPALKAFTPADLCRFMEERGVPLTAPDGFHLFPSSNKASDVCRTLQREVIGLGVEVRVSTRVEELLFSSCKTAVAGVRTPSESFVADRVIVATGGRSYPGLGGTGGGYGLAVQAGHGLIEPVPALVPLVTRETWPGACAGVSLDRVRLRVKKNLFSEGEVLFTHKGLSGPAALNLSGEVSRLLAKGGEVPLWIEWFPGVTAAKWGERFDGWRRTDGAKRTETLLAGHLPRSLAACACREAGIPPKTNVSHLTSMKTTRLAEWLVAAPLTVVDTAGFDRAMVTRGGVALKEVDPGTLESRQKRGLYFAGEILDLDGPCGGFNLQWAFSSGNLAGCRASIPR